MKKMISSMNDGFDFLLCLHNMTISPILLSYGWLYLIAFISNNDGKKR